MERRAMAIRLVRLLLLQVALKPCLAGTGRQLTELEDAYGLIASTVKMLKSCHECPANGIGIVGDRLDVLLSSLMSEPSIPVVFINDTRRRDYSAPVTSTKSYNLQHFLIMASSSSKLREHMAGMKKLRWWNHMADFWLVEWPVRENDCTNAYAFLWTAWRMNILEAKFVCVHGTRGRLIYGFNPFTRYAPDPWRLENVYYGKNEHAWSLFSRELSSATKPCRNMSFDKTEDLGGYEIRVTVKKSELVRLSPNKTGIGAVKCPVCSGFSTILRSLNATAILLVHEAEEPVGSVDARGNVDGILAEPYYGISDIALSPISNVNAPNLRLLHPYYFAGISIMTQYRGSTSQIQKIASLVDVTSRIGLLLVCLLTFIFFKYFLRQTSSIASLNVMRMICNSCLTKLPSSTSSRICLGSFFFFVVTFQGIYQGALSSLLAKRVSLRNIENIDDLRKSVHTIYAHRDHGFLFSDPEFQGRFVGLEYNNCTKHVLRSSTNACLRIHNLLLPDAAWFKLHLSDEIIKEQSLALLIREDWPLEQTFNKKFRALFEADVFRRTIDHGLNEKLNIVDVTENKNRDRRFKILNVIDLQFAFVILAIGLTIAAITFVVEVIRG